MKNATIATSRTRASADHVITYRPLPETWGDVDSLRAVRARKARAAARGTDPSTLEIPALLSRTDGPAEESSAASRRAPAHRAPRRGLWARLQGLDAGTQRLRRGGQHLATA